MQAAGDTNDGPTTRASRERARIIRAYKGYMNSTINGLLLAVMSWINL